ncbi:hypothetical protein G7047_10795 [Diaphorobacter sp. HDW4A]|nr:hypothetical protein G7047_10795 [Diaphorobacter sp. HDW4A]
MISAAASLLLSALPPAAQAAANTTTILTATVQAYPSCIHYEPRGICFFLICKPYCSLETSIRIRHYVPDVVVSTYHDSKNHPWTEVGKPLAKTLQSVGSSLIGAQTDSSGSNHRESTEMATFKSADAIGNPAGMITQMMSGDMGNFGDSFSFPGYEELMKFPTQELPNIMQQWGNVPQQAGNQLMESARGLANAPGALMSSISNFQSSLSTMPSGMQAGRDTPAYLDNTGGNTSNTEAGKTGVGTMDGLFGGSESTSLTGIQQTDTSTVDLSSMKEIGAMAEAAGGGNDYFCPGAASTFTLHFQSDMDILYWRGVIPLEMLYPQSWIPGMGEVSTDGLTHTWGPTYPRTGEVIQSHPVKASAVFASRVASIITQEAQPHIYKYLKPGGGFKYLAKADKQLWQMLYPKTETTCVTFGTNDAVSTGSFGDYKTDLGDAYMWNLWNRYDCCRIKGAFLFSVP